VFDRIAVIDRGEPALRLPRAVREDVIPAAQLRPRLIVAIERGMERAGRT
jgi:hypothetical protein